MEREILSTNRKALRLNLKQDIFGSFAEIGGGQEVARHFFQAGGASGTVAKTISAYDKSYSDYIYGDGKSKRYVSESRLIEMLDSEYNELCDLLSKKREQETRYFSFANTVATINYNKDNLSHGWIGIRFQLKPNNKPNEVILHVKMLENDPLQQQYTLGILGVNLIFACYYHWEFPNTFLKSLLDNLSTDRLEISMVKMTGPELDYVDNRLLAVQLVNNGMTPANMFDRNGNVYEPTDFLYKKNVLAFRGSFRPITYVGFDMLKASFGMFKRDKDYDKDNTISLCEITLNNMLEEGRFDDRDFIDRVDMLNGMGQNVIISNFREYYKLVSYLSQFKVKNLRVVIGIPTLINVLDEGFYTSLKGGILEALGKLFIDNMKLYVYPTLNELGNLVNSNNLPLDEDLKLIYRYLKRKRKIIDLEDVKETRLHIKRTEVLEMIKENKPGWEELVPVYIEEFIKRRKPFGYQGGEQLISRDPKQGDMCK